MTIQRTHIIYFAPLQFPTLRGQPPRCTALPTPAPIGKLQMVLLWTLKSGFHLKLYFMYIWQVERDHIVACTILHWTRRIHLLFCFCGVLHDIYLEFYDAMQRRMKFICFHVTSFSKKIVVFGIFMQYLSNLNLVHKTNSSGQMITDQTTAMKWRI